MIDFGFYNMDCMDGMAQIDDKSIDMILCDLPYGTTQCSWDIVIPFEPLWEEYKRIIKDNAAIVLFSQQPFTTDMINSNKKMFRYEIIWKKKAGEFTGTGKSGNSKDVADSHTERELQSPGSEQDIRNGVGISRKTLADAKSQFEGRLPVRKEPKKPRSIGGREDVQHADSAGCKEQYVTAEPDKEGFTGWGCDAGNVCNATSERLPDRTEEPMGGQRTQEQESERPMRRTAESVLGGMADGVPDGLDGDLDFILNHYWDEEPDIPRIATGIEHRVDRLKCLGNAVVPQQFYPIFKAIAQAEQTKGERSWRD